MYVLKAYIKFNQRCWAYHVNYYTSFYFYFFFDHVGQQDLRGLNTWIGTLLLAVIFREIGKGGVPLPRLVKTVIKPISHLCMYCNWWFVLSWVVKEQPAFCVFISQHTGCTEVNETPQEYKHPWYKCRVWDMYFYCNISNRNCLFWKCQICVWHMKFKGSHKTF